MDKMKEQFVTYEIALKLKELGFNEKCLATYSYNTQLYDKGRFELKTTPEPFYFPEVNLLPRFILAPLWQQVIDWFKEKHNMYIEITYEGGLQKDTSLYSFQIWSNQTSNKSDKMNYFKAREQAILKAIELCQKEK